MGSHFTCMHRLRRGLRRAFDISCPAATRVSNIVNNNPTSLMHLQPDPPPDVALGRTSWTRPTPKDGTADLTISRLHRDMSSLFHDLPSKSLTTKRLKEASSAGQSLVAHIFSPPTGPPTNVLDPVPLKLNLFVWILPKSRVQARAHTRLGIVVVGPVVPTVYRHTPRRTAPSIPRRCCETHQSAW